MATTEKKEVDLKTILLDSFGEKLILEKKFVFQENGNPRIKDGEPEIKSIKYLTLKDVLISTINHVDREEQTDLGELVKRGSMINKIRNNLQGKINLAPKWVEIIKTNLVKMKYDPSTIIQVLSMIDSSFTINLEMD